MRASIWPWVTAILSRVLPPDRLPPVIGDLEEDYQRRRLARGRLRAGWWLAREVSSLVRAYRREASASCMGDPVRPSLHLGLSVRQAARRLVRERRFTATALVTFGLCLGAALTIFAVVDAVLLRPLPYPGADRLVTIYNTYPGAGVPRDESSITNYYERRGALPGFVSVSVFREGLAVAGEPGAVTLERTLQVSAEFFDTLGIRPARGRVFREDEMTPGADGVAILTDAYWRRAFAADPSVVGRSVRLDGRDRTIVGVLPPGFAFLSSEARLYLPLSTTPDMRVPARRHWGSAARMIARLAPGVTVAEAQAQVDAHNARVTEASPSPDEARMAEVGFRSIVAGLQADHVASVRTALWLLLVGVVLLLLVGGVNLVNLFLVRAAARGREFAVRRAIGAGRRHVVVEVCVETLIVAALGGVVGLAVGIAGVRVVAGVLADQLPLGARIAVDGRMLLVAAACALTAGITMALPVTWLALRRRLAPALRWSSRTGTPTRSAERVRQAFIVGQVALAFVLVAGAGLLGLSLTRAMAVSPGFDHPDIVTGVVPLPAGSYGPPAERFALAERLVAALADEPGVTGAAVATNVPFSGNASRSAATVVRRDGEGAPPPHAIFSYGVLGEYFETVGIPVREGRRLGTADSRLARRVCVVDEDFAAYHWPGRSPIGRQLFPGGQAGDPHEAFTVVGVVGAVRQEALTDDTHQGAVYYPLRYYAQNPFFLVAGSTRGAARLGDAVRRVVRAVDPGLPVTDVASLSGRIDRSLLARRSPAWVSGLFAALALVLCAIGTYGVLSYAVAQRVREIGVRLALGASPVQVRRQFLGLGVRLLGAGLACGIGAAWLSGRAMSAMLYGVPAFHAGTLIVTTIVLTVVTLTASALPAWRAARQSPAAILFE